MKLVKDPVHGYIALSDQEMQLVDTYAVQRLRRISQLPFVHLVYPGARHSRFDHSLGCFHLAGEFASHLGLESHDANLLKAAALLHDIGHTPYSHLLETLLMERGVGHEELSARIIMEDDELGGRLDSVGVSPDEVVDILRGGCRLSHLISGPLDVDRLDFLVRDAYFTGATYGVIDVKRIIRLSTLSSEGPAVDVKGIGAVEELALARYHSFVNIYFHHAVRAAQVLFLHGAEKIFENVDLASMSVHEYLGYDDFTVWCMMRGKRETRWVVERLERRMLPKKVYERTGVGEVPLAQSRRRLEEEIAMESHVSSEWVYVDSSLAPPLTKYGPSEIRLYSGEGVVQPESWILRELSKPIHVVRVYVDRYVEDVDRVGEVAGRVISQTR
ncbi:MAG: HD domain-containing protein [Nitrososphaerota archaeon]